MVSRRDFLRALSVSAAASAQPKRPNILLILADDLGFECLGCYGSKSYRTPALDRMAADGMRFRYAFAQPSASWTRRNARSGTCSR